MADKRVLADTSILIDFFRKTDKSNSALFSLVKNDYTFCIGSITEYEIYTGATGAQMQYWQEFLQTIVVLPFDHNAVVAAVAINNTLKRKRKQIGMADLFIAATAISNNLPIATINKKHFERVESLLLV